MENDPSGAAVSSAQAEIPMQNIPAVSRDFTSRCGNILLMAFIFDDVFWFGMQINCNSRSIFVDRISKIYDFRVPFSRIVPPGAGGICNSRGVSG